MTPDDVRLAAGLVASTLASRPDADWSRAAGVLEWSVQETVAHMAGSVAKYALYLGSRSTRFIAVGIRPWPDAARGDQIQAIRGTAEALANIAEATPEDARGYHAVGMLTAEGFCGVACLELLVHGHDVAEGLGAAFVPPAPLVERLVARVVPWLAPEPGDKWQLLLWHTGRVQMSGRESHTDDRWRTVLTPLSEWDGAIPRRDPRPVVEWVGQQSGTWDPVYRDA